MNKFVLGMYYIRDIILNVMSRDEVVLISEPVKWAIYEDCVNIKNYLQHRISIRIAFTPIGLRRKIVHFASVGTLVKENRFRFVSDTNKIVLTWFHLNLSDGGRLKQMKEINTRVARLCTSCSITERQLIAAGLEEEKIVVVPIGVDTTMFHPATSGEKEKIRTNLGIPQEAIVIGSFQKDGSGWDEGLSPKLVKGPDVFCNVIEIIAKNHPIHVLLTGPSRGYIKRRLKAAGIPYSHVRFDNARDIASYYRTLDLYLIASRAEGGPKALLEAAASGVPVVTTNVGMVPDIMEHGVDCYIAPVEDVNMLVAGVEKLIKDSSERQRFSQSALKKAKLYDIRSTVQGYYEKIYKYLLAV